jgi:fatty-acyl-CoA synthase
MVGLADWVRFWSEFQPGAAALIDDHQEVTWGGLGERVAQLAQGLRARGIGRGDRVATLTSNRGEHFELLFACARLGGILVPLNPMLTAAEIAHTCADAAVAMVVTERELRPLLIAAAGGFTADAVVELDDHEQWSRLHGHGELHGDDIAAGDDPAMLCYTSGTTGLSKGAILTHRNIDAMASGAIAFDRLTTQDRALVTVPLAYNGGGVSLPLPVLKAGGSLLIRTSFDPPQMLRDIARYAITTIGVVPIILERLARDPGFESADLSSWRAAKCGGTVPPSALLALYQARGVLLSSAYGLTEAGGFNLLLPPHDAGRKRGSVGIPVLGQQAKVVDTEGDEVAPGVRGELTIRGDCVFPGYWRNEPATLDVLRDGWLRTGDAAVRDEDGYHWIVDRMKDMIISGGVNIYPAEVEAVLAEHPDVREVAVVGMTDPEWGEAPVAWVVTNNPEMTLEELTDFADGRLARYKRIKKLVIVDALPRGATGKVLKRDMRRMLEEAAGIARPSDGLGEQSTTPS